jgi:hypothetical protein
MEDNNMYYENVKFDYTNHIVEVKDNVYQDKWETTTLEKALHYCQDVTHQKHYFIFENFLIGTFPIFSKIQKSKIYSTY